MELAFRSADTSSRGGVESRHAHGAGSELDGCPKRTASPADRQYAGVAPGPRETPMHICHFEGRQIQEVHTSWRRIVKKSGLSGRITPHTLRHTRATWLMQAGVSPWEAAGHLGMTVKTLESVYGHHHPAYQERAAEV